MTTAITIPIEQSRRHNSSDRGRIEIDAIVQPDVIVLWGPQRDRIGLGHGRLGRGMLGRGVSLGLGRGALGRGRLGQGARLIAHNTRNAFPAGDYTIRAQARDELRNTGDWSAPYRHPHRPTPPEPRNVAIVPGTSVLSWAWSESNV